MQQLYDVPTAAGFLSISSWTLRSYLKQGKLRPVRIGRRVLIDEEELAKFVAKSKSQTEVTNDGIST